MQTFPSDHSVEVLPISWVERGAWALAHCAACLHPARCCWKVRKCNILQHKVQSSSEELSKSMSKSKCSHHKSYTYHFVIKRPPFFNKMIFLRSMEVYGWEHPCSPCRGHCSDGRCWQQPAWQESRGICCQVND